MDEQHIKIVKATEFLKNHLRKPLPDIGIILGSGLGAIGDELDDPIFVDTRKIPNWPVSTVEGHRGRIVYGLIDRVPVLVLQGRVHYYEGYTIQEVVFPVRVLSRLGINMLIVTNAAGGIDPSFRPGDLMAITDHINCMGTNPLIGFHGPEMTNRFPEMSQPYDQEFIIVAEEVSRNLNIPLRKGVLASTSGPSYETAAEVRMLRLFGADAVCMSTVPEVIAGVQMGMRILGFSCITNMATGISPVRLSHKQVEETAQKVEGQFKTLIRAVVNSIHKLNTRPEGA